MINKNNGRHPHAIEVEGFMKDPEKMRPVLGYPLYTTLSSTNGATYSFLDIEFTYDFYDPNNEWYNLTVRIGNKEVEAKKGIPYK